MDIGLYKNVPFEDYEKIDAFNSHLVLPILRSPLHALAYKNKSISESQSIITGKLVDTLICKPDEFEDSFSILPEKYINSKGKEADFTKQSKTCREIYESISKANKTPITKDVFDKAQKIKEAVMNHSAAKNLLDGCDYQVTAIWEQEAVDSLGNPLKEKCLCKSMIDAFKEGAIIDLKTTKDASSKSFSRDILKYGYHIQASFYTDAIAYHNQGAIYPYYIIAVENEEPYGVHVFNLGEDSIATGRVQYNEAMAKYIECKKTGVWYGYPTVIDDVDIPRWAIDRVLNEGVMNV